MSPDRARPRQGATISIFQPQIEGWTGNTINARAAVRVKSATSTDYGVIWLTARTEVDKVNRAVTLLDVKITKQNFTALAAEADLAAFAEVASDDKSDH